MATELVQALLTTHSVLAKLGVESAIMGGLAVAAWNRRRATDDIDLLIAVDAVDPGRLLQSMQTFGFRPRRLPAVTDFDGERVMQLEYTPPGKFFEYDVDLFFAESPYHRSAFSRRSTFTLPDGEIVPVLTCEDLILFKLQADRMIDRIDVIELLRLNRPDLDFGYIRMWLTAPPVQQVWSDCWQRAFPGEPDPVFA
jgi:hypothetical protein